MSEECFDKKFDEGIVRNLSDPEEYRRVMSFPLTFDVGARTENYEEYELRIVAKTQEQAEQVAESLCESLELILMYCTEHEWLR